MNVINKENKDWKCSYLKIAKRSWIQPNIVLASEKEDNSVGLRDK